MITPFLNTLGWVGIGQCIFMVVFLLIRHHKPTDNILIGLMATLCFIMATGPIKSTGVTSLGMFNLLYDQLFITLIFIYTKYIVDTYDGFQRRDWLHLLPGGLLLLFFLLTLRPSMINDAAIAVYLKKYHIVFWVMEQYFLVSVFVYAFLSFRKIRQFRNQIQEAYSYDQQQLQLYWLMAFIAFALLFCLSSIFVSILWHLKVVGEYIEVINSVTTLTMVYLLSMGGIMQKQLVMARTSNEPAAPKPVVAAEEPIADEPQQLSKEKYFKSTLSPEQEKEYAQTLISYVANERAWVDPELSIAKLSKATGIRKAHITQTLNERIGKNFYTLINEYRVKAAMEMMVDPRYHNYTFMAIAYDCGFNSKTAFYTVFKKFTGTTPTEYKKKEGTE